MGQKLILPINSAKLTASMKTEAYRKRFGFEHYGADIVSSSGDRTVWASGEGEVLACGNDNVVGNVVAVLYPKAQNHTSGENHDVVFRYFHLDSIGVKQGDRVGKDTKLGMYGNTGQYSTGAHLHLEADADTAYPLHSPTVSASNYIMGKNAGANDKTMSNPLDWLYKKTDEPDYQTWSTADDVFISNGDKTLPELYGPVEGNVRIEGIDISSHNGNVNWDEVKAAGKEFVFIRLGWAGWDGDIAANGGIDKRFHENIRGALAAGLHTGVYVYSYCKTPEAAAVAAREALELVKPYGLAYPIAFDIEDTSDGGVRYDKMDPAENSAIAAAFLNAVETAGYMGILYTYKSFAENYLDIPAVLNWDMWIAQYSGVCTYSGDYGIWQYRGDAPGFTGACPGVNGACDLNVSYRDYASFIREKGINRPSENGGTAPSGMEGELASLRAGIEELRGEISEIKGILAAKG